MDIIAIQNIETGLTKPKIIPQLTTRPIIILVRLLSVRIKRPPPSPRLAVQILNDLKIILRSGTRTSIPFFLFLVLLLFFFFLLLFIFVSGLFFLRLIPIIIRPNTSSSPDTSTSASASSRAISILPIALHPLSGVINHLHIPISIPSSNTRNTSLGISHNAILGLLKLALPGFDIGIRL
jgi:hypothetical protein